MAITVNWGTKVITVPQADLLLVQSTPIEVYELNINDLRLELRTAEDDALGIPHSDTHIYTAPLTVAGTTLARVVEILEPYTLTFTPDLAYGVNVVGGNSNVPDRTNPNNVSVRSDNSAGLQDSESLQAASFNGEVTIDITSGITGTTFPRGTQGFPVDNLADAHAIAEARGISRFLVRTSMTLDNEVMNDGYTFRADKVSTVITAATGADLEQATFMDAQVTGVLGGNNRLVNCEVYDLTTWGQLRGCGLAGTLTLNGTGGALSQLIDCHSDVAGGGPGQFANIDMNTSGNDLAVRGYVGGLGVLNMNDSLADVSMDLGSGRVTVASTVVDGTIVVRGLCEVIDNSTGTASVDDRTGYAVVRRISSIVGNKMVTDPVTGLCTVYDDDDTTVLWQGNLWEDATEVQQYRGQGAEVRERLA